ncbi:PREDICTED: F-box [Prunus dulcis]|uniref:PREDICTED: F-box n=1 Tax=Prunus dulcis TaxID=3755 RepID=A0A5E4G192_PRUDU|nr:PREDICTED: F-box [Prunus dulcis]
MVSLPFDSDETLGTSKVVHPMPPWKHGGRYTLILGYSIGLLFICNYDLNKDFTLWNPSIQKLKKLPFTTLEPHPSPGLEISRSHITNGFGYDLANDDYKLLGILELANSDDVIVSSQVHVYSLKSHSWKRIQNMPCDGYGFSEDSDSIVFLNGALSWLMSKESDGADKYMIVTLDLASEKCREFPIPVDRIDIDISSLDLEVLGDYLCVSVNCFWCRSEAWIMKEYGVTVTESWSLLYSIDLGPRYDSCKPLVFSKNGKMVLLKLECNDADRFFWYDLEKKSVKQVETSGLPRCFDATIWWGSLCLLDGDPVIAESRQQVPTTSKKGKYSSR